MTNGEPPPAKVTDLQADSDGPLCPGETVTFEATTSPPSATVTWKVAVNGGEPEVVEGDGNTLEVFGIGQTKVVTASLTNSLSRTVTWKVADLKVNVPPGPNNGRYVITDEPRMPVISATAVFEGDPDGSATVSEWEVSVVFRADDCPPFGPDDLRTDFSFSGTGGNEITADFPENVVRGGSITFSAKGLVNGCAVSAVDGTGLVGTNPQRTDIENFLKQKSPDTYRTLQRIACRESGQRQFNAPPNGGTGFCPLFGPGGKVGIMQIAKPTDDQVWNWKENVTAGIEKFKKSVAAAEDYHNKVMQSEGFQDLVERFNQRRQQQGLEIVKEVVLLRLQEGDFNADDDSDLQQRELDAIRGYNHSPDEEATEDDSTDKDRFGLPLHEYRVVVDLIDGEEVLRVANITNSDEGTLRGEAVWERVSLADRATGRIKYVEEVLAFAFDCTAHTVPCNLTGISPATQTLFVGSRPFRFTAEGTGLAGVKWKASGNANPKTGKGATFKTKWSESGQQPETVTATCGGTTQTATVIVLDVEIQINNTESTNDDVVQVKCKHPPRTFTVPCRIKVKGPATAPVKVILKNLDSRLTFPPDASVKEIELPANGNWKDFEIAGEKASRKIGDAKIIVQDEGPGDDVAEKKVTVFSFDQAQMLVTKGSNYRLVRVSGGTEFAYEPDDPGISAVDFSAKARLIPAGLDCTAGQIAFLRVAIMQEVSGFRSTTTWDRPIIKWGPGAQDGDTVEVERVTRVETTWDSTVKQPVNDGESNNVFLQSTLDSALKPPTGCDGAAAAESASFPSTRHITPTISRPAPFPNSDATVTWTRLVNTTLESRFRTFCVVFDLGTKEFCALRQARWTLNVDSSGPPANQHAIVHADAPASADPAMPPPTRITAGEISTPVAVGTAKKRFKFPKTD